jgi:hypothetical protein
MSLDFLVLDGLVKVARLGSKVNAEVQMKSLLPNANARYVWKTKNLDLAWIGESRRLCRLVFTEKR